MTSDGKHQPVLGTPIAPPLLPSLEELNASLGSAVHPEPNEPPGTRKASETEAFRELPPALMHSIALLEAKFGPGKAPSWTNERTPLVQSTNLELEATKSTINSDGSEPNISRLPTLAELGVPSTSVPIKPSPSKTPSPGASPKDPDCPNSVFKSKQSLTRHQNTDHKGVRDFPCDICDTDFQLKSDAVRHLARVHSVGEFRCEECPIECPKPCPKPCPKQCPKVFGFQSDLNRHLALAHTERVQGIPGEDLLAEVVTEDGERSFMCVLCELFYRSRDLAAEHLTKGHRRHQCDLCDRSATSRADLERHKASVHQIGDYVCKICKRVYGRESDLQRHVEAHSTEVKFQCNQCEKSFKAKRNLQIHVKSAHEGIRDFECPFCDKRFSQKGDVRTHVARMHENNRPFECNFCGKRCVSQSELNNHVRLKHDNPEQFMCEDCERPFASKRNLEQHIAAVHEKVKRFECHICNRAFAQKGVLDNHVARIHETRTFQCQTCQKFFARMTLLKKHEMTHLPPQFECPICNKPFASKRNVDKHVKHVHDGVKDFECSQCGKPFAQKADLQIHMQRVHTFTKKFDCGVCVASFSELSGRNKHMERKHQGVKQGRHKCKHCGKFFADLYDHITQEHAVKKHMCEVCEEMFASESAMKMHSKAIHESEFTSVVMSGDAQMETDCQNEDPLLSPYVEVKEEPEEEEESKEGLGELEAFVEEEAFEEESVVKMEPIDEDGF